MNSRQAKAAIAGVAVSASTVSFVAGYEGHRSLPYLDVGAVLTVCKGHTGADIEPRYYSPAECDQLLQKDLVAHTTVMLRMIDVPLSEGEMIGYSSFVFNVGATAFRDSTLRRLLNANQRVAACKELLRWVRVKGRVIRGLQNRRAAEYKLCRQPDLKVAAS